MTAIRERQWRKLNIAGMEAGRFNGRDFFELSPSTLELLAAEAFHDLSFYLRADFLDELAACVADPQASSNERFVCSMLIKNAIIAAEGVLPICQDTGTALIFGWRGNRIISEGDDAEYLSHGVATAWRENALRYSMMAATSMFEDRNTGTNLPAQIDLQVVPGNEYQLLCIAKGGGSANKTWFFQGTKALLNEKALADLLRERILALGVTACPPYFLSAVIGGTSAEENLRIMKLATTGWLDNLPLQGDGSGAPFRDLEWEQRMLKMAAETNWGAQFGGRHMAVQARVIRLSRHAASVPISVGVSCSAHRNVIGKINPQGVFLEELDRNPARLTSYLTHDSIASVSISLEQPMAGILRQLGELAPGTLVKLNGPMLVARDIAHAKFREMITQGSPLPEYLKRHPVCYAGPSKTPDGYVTGSIGPTTAERMDPYMDELMSRGAAMVTIAKGNRSEVAIKACKQHGGFYLGMIGGAAALLASKHVASSEIIDFKECGMEAVRLINVRDMPAFIIYDNKGGDLYQVKR